MFRTTSSFAFILLAVSCQQSPASGDAPEVKAQKSALEAKSGEVKWPELLPTGYPGLTLELSTGSYRPIAGQPHPGSTHAAETSLPLMAGAPFEVGDGHAAIKVKLREQQPVVGVLKDDLVQFPGSWHGADVTMRAIAEGIEDFVALDGTRPPSIDYEVELVGIEGLRLVENELEFLTADGNPALRMAPPFVSSISKKGRVPVTVSVQGCAYDSSPLPPWGKPVTAPGATHCTVHLQWDAPSDFYPALLDPTWSLTGNLAIPRFSYGVANLPISGTNVTLVCGGYNSAFTQIPNCEMFFHLTGTWANTGSMVLARADFGFAYSAGSTPGPRVVAVSGAGPGDSWIETYNPATGLWTNSAGISPREHVTATTLPGDQNIVVIVGGQYGSGMACGAIRATEIWHYRINTGGVSLVANLTAGRALHQATALPNGTILVTGGIGTCCPSGCTGGVQLAEVIGTNGVTVTSGGNMIRAGRQKASVFVLPSGQMRIGGGVIDTITSQVWPDSELYTPPSTWNDFKTFPGGAQCGGWGTFGIMTNGNLLLAGGATSAATNQSTACTFVYDAANAWRADGNLSAARRGMAGATTWGGAVMAIGGVDTSPTVVFARTELFDLLPNGSPCAGNGLCQSQLCVDGVCCNTVCNAGTCDSCNVTGLAGTCSPSPASTVCRPASGALCDVAENCTGTTTACPADGFAGPSTTCRPAATTCDVAEVCPGGTPNCPADTFAAATVVCRPAAVGGCDVAENCTGSSSACPADSFRPTSFTCRTSMGVCDVAENCPGNAAACPTDGFAANTVMCRGDAGVCDVAEFCTGSAAACPNDAVQPATVACRGAADLCDAVENCDGTSVNCPADMMAPATTVCRGTQGTCDVVETCSGSSITCGSDALKDAGVVCNTTYLCSGVDAGCPTSCTLDGGECAPGAACVNGECVIQVTPGNPCTSDNQCTTLHCVDGVCCDTACTEACATCNQAGSVGTCTAEPAGSPGDPSCSPYVCDGTARICPGSCANNSNCVTGFVCVAGRCVNTLPNGTACTADAQCASTFCTDGVCCNSRCDQGACQSCNVPGALGTCSIAGRGEVGSPSCAPFVCDGTNPDCPTTCSDDAECGPPAFCENKKCVDRTRGHVGFSCGGCSSVDGASLLGLLGVATLLRRRRAQGGAR